MLKFLQLRFNKRRRSWLSPLRLIHMSNEYNEFITDVNKGNFNLERPEEEEEQESIFLNFVRFYSFTDFLGVACSCMNAMHLTLQIQMRMHYLQYPKNQNKSKNVKLIVNKMEKFVASTCLKLLIFEITQLYIDKPDVLIQMGYKIGFALVER